VYRIGSSKKFLISLKDFGIFPDNSWQKLHLTPDKIQKVLVFPTSEFLIFSGVDFSVEELFFQPVWDNFM